MTNIPTIEELDKIGCKAAGFTINASIHPDTRLHLTAIRDAVVAACRPQLRPIAEMPAEVPEGCVRVFVHKDAQGRQKAWRTRGVFDTHYIDVALPVEVYPVDFEQAFAESGLIAKDKDAAFKLWQMSCTAKHAITP